jgi:uncharacterized protein (DUF433 family)/DNA-binding transcriptional MerR regulator
MAASSGQPRVGDGIYTFGEASRILRAFDPMVSVRRLRYWMGSDLVVPTYQLTDETPILSFDDLISLEVIRRFRKEKTPLQSVRRLESALRKTFPELVKPFAYRRFFTDGASVWAEEIGESGPIVVELLGRRPHHYAWTEAIKTFAVDISWEGEEQHATSWHLSPWVEIDPRIQAGAPVVRGTRVPVRTIAANLKVGSADEVADWYGLSVDQVKGVSNYLAVG